jgi:hypothetical protein
MPIAGGGLTLDSSLHFNARISRSTEIISLNLGVISALSVIALTAAEDENLVASVMSPASSTIEASDAFDWPIDPFSEDPEIVNVLWERPLPQFGSSEWFTFTNVFYGALRFILIHEQAHLLQGHVPYAAQLGFSDDFLELSSESRGLTQEPVVNFRRILEHDADRFAFHFLLMPFMPWKEGGNRERLRERLLEGHSRVAASFCGACLCFAALANRDSDGRHPTAMFRLRQALVNMQATLNFEDEFTYNEIDHMTAQLLPAASAIFSKFRIMGQVHDVWRTVEKMPDDHFLAAEYREFCSLSKEVLPMLRSHQESVGGKSGYLFWGGVQP